MTVSRRSLLGGFAATLGYLAAKQDKLVPPDVVRRAAKRYAHVSEYLEYDNQGHWVLGQPGWERVAEQAEAWLIAKAG